MVTLSTPGGAPCLYGLVETRCFSSLHACTVKIILLHTNKLCNNRVVTMVVYKLNRLIRDLL